MISSYCKKEGNVPNSIEFLLMAKQNEDAFQVTHALHLFFVPAVQPMRCPKSTLLIFAALAVGFGAMVYPCGFR